MEPGKADFSTPKRKKVEAVTASPGETVSIGVLLGTFLKSGDIVCLDGDLGAGKTAFTSGIAKGMGIKGIVSSPTFTILIEHSRHAAEGSLDLPLFHFDAYRIGNEQEFYDLGFDEYFSFRGVCVIEWAGKIRGAIPDHAIWVTMRQSSDDISDKRILEFSFQQDDGRSEKFSQEVGGLGK